MGVSALVSLRDIAGGLRSCIQPQDGRSAARSSDEQSNMDNGSIWTPNITWDSASLKASIQSMCLFYLNAIVQLLHLKVVEC